MPRLRHCCFPLSITLAAIAPVAAQSYPVKPVRVIVPYPPGGGNDIIARAVGDELSRRIGQQFIVDNRPGASTIIGAELAMKSPPDGYTLFVSSQTTLAIVPNLKTRVPYDPLRDFEPVSLLATQPYLVVVHPSLPAQNVAQLIALAKSFESDRSAASRDDLSTAIDRMLKGHAPARSSTRHPASAPAVTCRRNFSR